MEPLADFIQCFPKPASRCALVSHLSNSCGGWPTRTVIHPEFLNEEERGEVLPLFLNRVLLKC